MVQKDFFWAAYCQGVAVGDTEVENTYGFGTNKDFETELDNTLYSIFDTGSSSLMISSVYYDSFILKIMT